MKIRFMFASLLLCAMVLTSCAMPKEAPVDTILTTEHTQPISTTTEPEAQPTLPPVTQPDSLPTESPTTQAAHSQLYIPDIPVEDVVRYFNEVCLDAEYANSGDPSVLQKWEAPIYYTLNGSPTEEDLRIVSQLARQLNEIDGFPGIYETADAWEASLRIHFGTADEMLTLMGDDFVDMDGAVTFWYTDTNAIYDAIICCRTDLDQTLRNSVIMEEIYNALGPIQDTYLREDSIIYAEFSQPQALSEMDELILKLLYHPRLECGMDRAECEAVIRELYY